MSRRHLVIVLVGLMAVACNGTPTGPSLRQPAPVNSQPTPPNPAVEGDISLSSIAPPAGAVVEIWDCDGVNASRHRVAHATGLCSDRLALTFAILADRDVPEATLELYFDDGVRPCAYGGSTVTALTAGHLGEVRSTYLLLSEIPDLWEPCPLPARTTRFTAHLWELRGNQRVRVLLSRSFDLGYTFAMR